MSPVSQLPFKVPTNGTVLFLSDLHLMVKGNPADAPIGFIEEQAPKGLVLPGDVLAFHEHKYMKDRSRIVVNEGRLFLDYLINHFLKVDPERWLIIMPGNHDPEWDTIAEYIPELSHLIHALQYHPQVRFETKGRVHFFTDQGDVAIVHGHKLPYGDLLWHLGELKERLFGVPAPKLVTEATRTYLRRRSWLVHVAEFMLWRMRMWARFNGFRTVIFGHIHEPFDDDNGTVRLISLPCWKADEGALGGGALYTPPGRDTPSSWQLIRRKAP